jgi:RNA polymerase sigma factor (sigma-70 family)
MIKHSREEEAKVRDRVPTRSSFVERLRDFGDQSAWEEFFRVYALTIRGLGERAGLSFEEAEDAVQETAMTVAKKMSEFEYERSRCSFGGWVGHVARRRIVDQVRRRGAVQSRRLEDDEKGSLMESIPDPGVDGVVEGGWEEMWRASLLKRALERLQLNVTPRHFQIFHLNVVLGVSGPEVVRTLGVSLAQVYVVRHRLTRMLKREVERLRATPGGLG